MYVADGWHQQDAQGLDGILKAIIAVSVLLDGVRPKWLLLVLTRNCQLTLTLVGGRLLPVGSLCVIASLLEYCTAN
ncbi:hypothetical protein P3T76_002154 [Phytophthora citrophthora]|uniref:Uncharacterized protein n=1 Tax=Phytophthora citrophthora TaxID=4793 RepID=A0AAD9GXL1_9STRA|nr:hypothetical protein P3T76_002154 [Phytophthora citrophthora]